MTEPDLDKIVQSNSVPARSQRQNRMVIGLYIGLVVALALAGWGLAVALASQHDAKTADHHAASASSAAAANQVALGQANSEAVAHGGTAVPTPAPVSGAQGQRGPGPTDVEIADAVTVYCAAHSGCAGIPSQDQVLDAVRAFCAADACRGATGSSGSAGSSGEPGASGQPGQNGQAGNDGNTGPGPTDDQINTAVAAYCSGHGDCTGPAGPKGDTGSTGPVGRGISSIDCTGLGVDQLVIHYDDGTDQTVPCDVPTPTDTPSGAPSS